MRLKVTRKYTTSTVVDLSSYQGMTLEQAKKYEQGLTVDDTIELLGDDGNLQMETEVEFVE